MNQMQKLNSQQLQGEVSRLNEELQMRDQLIQQLSQELFRLVKGNTSIVPKPIIPEGYQSQMQSLKEELNEVEQQVTFYQEQISERDAEIYNLRHSVQELTDRSQMLEQVVQELPEVYRQKFSERLAEVLEKVEMLQKENRQLHAELQSVSYRLAVRNRRANDLDLPAFGSGQSGSSVEMPTFGNV